MNRRHLIYLAFHMSTCIVTASHVRISCFRVHTFTHAHTCMYLTHEIFSLHRRQLYLFGSQSLISPSANQGRTGPHWFCGLPVCVSCLSVRLSDRTGLSFWLSDQTVCLSVRPSGLDRTRSNCVDACVIIADVLDSVVQLFSLAFSVLLIYDGASWSWGICRW